MKASQWSDTLQSQTREALHQVPATPDGYVHMKNIDGRFGRMSAMDLIANTYVLLLKDRDETQRFGSVDALIDAGWAID